VAHLEAPLLVDRSLLPAQVPPVGPEGLFIPAREKGRNEP
jgi:hypothetical protein